LRIRRTVLAILGGGALFGLLPLTGGGALAFDAPATQFAAQATSYQNQTIAETLAGSPSATRIGPNQVEWKNGSVIMTVPATPNAGVGNCPTGGWFSDGWTCIYNDTRFHGTRLQFHDCCYAQNIYDYYQTGVWTTWSWSNTRGERSRLWQTIGNPSDHGYSLCMNPNSASSHAAGFWMHDPYIYLGTDPNHC
jgi:hypothetical protein